MFLEQLLKNKTPADLLLPEIIAWIEKSQKTGQCPYKLDVETVPVTTQTSKSTTPITTQSSTDQTTFSDNPEAETAAFNFVTAFTKELQQNLTDSQRYNLGNLNALEDSRLNINPGEHHEYSDEQDPHLYQKIAKIIGENIIPTLAILGIGIAGITAGAIAACFYQKPRKSTNNDIENNLQNPFLSKTNRRNDISPTTHLYGNNHREGDDSDSDPVTKEIRENYGHPAKSRQLLTQVISGEKVFLLNENNTIQPTRYVRKKDDNNPQIIYVK